MFKNLFRKNKPDLAQRCADYLNQGPPQHMTDYVPDSLTEIIISYGAQREPLNDELIEIASLILVESEDINDIEDLDIRKYVLNGSKLVQGVLESQ